MDNGFASFITIVGSSGLARSDWGIVNQLQEVLSVARDDGDLLAVLAESIELVAVCGLDLLAGNVGQLSFGDKRLGFGTDKLLFEDDNLGGVGFLVFQLSNLISDFLLAWIQMLANCGFFVCNDLTPASNRGVEGGEGKGSLTVTAGLNRGLDVTDALHRNSVLIVSVNILILQLADFVDEDTKLVGDVRDILICSLTPDR